MSTGQLEAVFKTQVNELAQNFYNYNGYLEVEGFDFSESEDPDKKLMFNLAIAAYAFINKTPELLYNQVDLYPEAEKWYE